MIGIPKISVIIPVYNVECYLKECLDSVVNQSLRDIEIICVNDGSKDLSLNILKEYSNKDSRIRLINKINGGYGSACNAGFKEAKGEYIAIVEPDDFIALNMYETLYKSAVDNDADVVKSAFYENYDTQELKKLKKVNWSEKQNLPTGVFQIKDCPLFLYFHPSVWSCIYKNEFIKKHKISFVEAKGSGWTDNPFQVQTLCLAERICYINEAYYYWRKRNLDDSDDLKDYTIPFKRSDEIYEWFEAKNVNDKGILSCLMKRELTYINLVFKMIDSKNIVECLSFVKKMIMRWDESLIKNSIYIEKKEKRQYFMIKHMPMLLILISKAKKLRKKLFIIRWNSREKLIKVGNLYLVKEVVSA